MSGAGVDEALLERSEPNWAPCDDSGFAPSEPPAAPHAGVLRHLPRREPPATSSALLMRILDQLDYGLMLVDERAQLRFANRVALRECTASRCISVEGGHVRPRHEPERAPFLKAVAAACQGRRSMLTLRLGGAPLSLALVPVAEPVTGVDGPGTLLVLGRRQVCEPLSADFFAREHGLTAAEGAVLRGLCQGLRPTQIARAASVAVSTVRTQIGSIRLKTGAGSIAELVRMVTVLPPIVALLS